MNITIYFSKGFLLIFALLLGINFPDLDQRFSLLIHRSILTHGFILPLLLFLIANSSSDERFPFFSIGFSLATAVHLCFDLFPRLWLGFALIHIPILGRTAPFFSWAWIAVSIILCLHFAFKLTRTQSDHWLVGGGLLIGFILYATTQPSANLPTFALIIGIALTISLHFPHQLSSIRRLLKIDH